MDTTNVKLTAGQINDLPKPEEPFQYIAPIDYLTAAYICNGKIKTVSDINDFISRNEDFSDIIQKKIAFLIDTGAMRVNADEEIELDHGKDWYDSKDPTAGIKTIPDLVMGHSKRGLIDRINCPNDKLSFSGIVDFPDCPEINEPLKKLVYDFSIELKKLVDSAAKQKIKSDKVRAVSISSGFLVEEDFS